MRSTPTASTTSRPNAPQRLPAGDYAVELDGVVVAAVERKSLSDLAGSLLSGRLTYALAELTTLPRAAVVVEDRYGALFKLARVSGGQVAEALAETQARFPGITVMFARPDRWRRSGPTASWAHAPRDQRPRHRPLIGPAGRPAARPAPPEPPDAPRAPGDRETPVDAAAVRRWAIQQGLSVSPRGRVAGDLVRAYLEAGALPPP